MSYAIWTWTRFSPPWSNGTTRGYAAATFQPQQLHRTKCSGMSLQICRSRFNFDSVTRRLRTLFVLSCGRVALNLPAFLLDLMGWLFMFIMIRRNVLVMNSLAPD